MRVEVWSDVVCPWCYIGKRKFDAAASRYRNTTGDDVDIVYRPFMLDPGAPTQARPVREVYERKFGGAAAADRIIDRVTAAAAEVGIGFRLDKALRANTLSAHRLLVLAADEQLQPEMKERLMQAYFVEGADIGQRDVLVALATDVGLETERADQWLSTSGGSEAVADALALAADNEITSVPTYVLDGRLAVPGAQSPETFLRLMTRLARSDDGSLAN